MPGGAGAAAAGRQSPARTQRLLLAAGVGRMVAPRAAVTAVVVRLSLGRGLVR